MSRNEVDPFKLTRRSAKEGRAYSRYLKAVREGNVALNKLPAIKTIDLLTVMRSLALSGDEEARQYLEHQDLNIQ